MAPVSYRTVGLPCKDRAGYPDIYLVSGTSVPRVLPRVGWRFPMVTTGKTFTVFDTDKGAVRFHHAYTTRTGKVMPATYSAWSVDNPFGFQFPTLEKAKAWLLKQ